MADPRIAKIAATLNAAAAAASITITNSTKGSRAV